MLKRIVPYIVPVVLLVVTLMFFNMGYRALIKYSELTNRHNTVLNGFQHLSKEINKAAILNPDLTSAIKAARREVLFYTDSLIIFQQVNLLRITARDSVNIRIADQLNALIRSEISWLINSNVPDSILRNKAIVHIAAFEAINSLIDQGINRTVFLIDERKSQLKTEIRNVRLLLSSFIILSVLLLLYTTVRFFRQKEKTKNKERELEVVLNRINEGVVSVDNSWRYTFLNNAAMANHPLGREKTLGKIIWDIHPEMKGTIFWDKYHEAMETGMPVVIENYYPPMDTWFSVNVYPSDDGLTIFYKNVTENRKFQEHQALFASIVNSSGDAIISKTIEGIITSWNHGAEKIFKYTSDEIIGHHISTLIPAKLIKEEDKIMGQIRIGEAFDHFETERVRKDGKVITVSLTVYPIRDAVGKIIGASKICRDLTRQKEAETQLASNEIRFRSLIENCAEGITLTDRSANVLYRSPGSEKITGILPKENTISRSHPDDLLSIKTKLTELLNAPGIPINFQGRFLNASDKYIWLEGTFTNLLKVDGVNAIVTNFRDITQRKESEETIRKSEKTYKTIASNIPGSVICLLDSDYRYLLIEGDMHEKLGYSKNQLLGNKASEVLTPEIFDIVREDFKRAFEGETLTRESNQLGYDIITRFIPLRDENNVVFSIMTVAINVTKLKNAQRDFVKLNLGLEEKIKRSTEQLIKSNEDLGAFSYSVSHDLRAPLRGIIGFAAILEDEYGTKLDAEANRIITVIKDNTIKMGQLIDDLLTFSRMGKQDIHKTKVNIQIMITEIVNELDRQNGNPQTIEWQIGELPQINADMNTIRQVWINLLSNAVKYSRNTKQPCITIDSSINEGYYIFSIKDNGVGFDEKYSAKLFKVFQRLHDSDQFEGTGIGLALVEKIVSRHGGKVWAKGKQDEGACFYFSLPI